MSMLLGGGGAMDPQNLTAFTASFLVMTPWCSHVTCLSHLLMTVEWMFAESHQSFHCVLLSICTMYWSVLMHIAPAWKATRSQFVVIGCVQQICFPLDVFPQPSAAAYPAAIPTPNVSYYANSMRPRQVVTLHVVIVTVVCRNWGFCQMLLHVWEIVSKLGHKWSWH